MAVPPAVDEPTAHVAQLLAPAALNLESAPHCVCMLLPSHDEPAGHALHEVRVVVVPPAVNEPAAHVLCALHEICAPLSWYWPFGQFLHVVCALLSWNWPFAQFLHEFCALLSWNWPPLHAEQKMLPLAAKRPAVHCACVPLPSHDEPAGHAAHEVRVAAVPPAVNEPAAHVAQLLAPAALYLESAPHAEHVLLPLGSKCPAVHSSSRRTAWPNSTMYAWPCAPSSAMPYGPLKRAAVPAPSALPLVPLSPATVVTAPVDSTSRRTAWLK